MQTIKNIFFLIICSLAVHTVNAQNLNNPNKTGPLGTQVNTISGNLFITRMDFAVTARAFDLEMMFYYNSYDFNQNFNYGNGWSFVYDIAYRTDTGNHKILKWGDGREDQYLLLSGGAYQAPRGFFDQFSQYQPDKFLLTKLNGDKYFFDNATHKRITRMEEPNGNFINFSYTDTLLTSLINAAGQSITFTYNAQGQLAQINDAITTPNRNVIFNYDGQKNLISVTDPLGAKMQYTYLPNGPMKTMADKNNNLVNIIFYPDYSTREIIGCNKRISFSYDTATRTTIATDHIDGGQNQITTYKYQKLDNISWLTDVSGNCCGYNMKYEYDDQGNQTKMTDANGNVSTYTYDTKGNMLTMTDALGQTSTYTYTANYNRIATYKDEKGFLYSMTYDAAGNLTQMVTPGNQTFTATYNAAGDIISSTDPKGHVFTYNYDSFGNPTSVTGPENYSATLSFDARGNLLAMTDARNNTTTVQYDILDRLKKITDPINNNIQYSYDANGNATQIKTKNNENYLLNYDASNRLVKLTDPIGNQTSMNYDAQDNLKGVTNAIGNQMKMSYDTRNRLTATTDPEGNSNTYNYDAHGNVTSATMKNGRRITYTYDNLHRLTGAADETGVLGSIVYDANSNITSITNATGATTSMLYDNLNRVTKVTDPLSNSSTYTYDLDNNIATITDRNGNTSIYTYDNLDRPKTVTDNNGFVTSINYDAQGNVSQLIDQNNNTTSYTYDSLNRRKTMTLPDGKFTQHFYDKKGNVVSMRRTDGTVVNYVYDSINRLKTRILPDGEVYAYTYDALSRVVTASNNAGAVVFTYDNLNRVTSETFDGRTTAYQYNIAGRTQTTTYPNGSVVVREFDARNRLTSISKDSVSIADYTYNNANQVLSKTFGNGIITNMQYDFANRLSSISTRNGTIQNTSFAYDKERNKTAINRNNNGALSEQFTYDNGYRLINYKRGIPGGASTINNTYNYDAVGNRTATILNGATSNYNTNNLNQITSISGAQNTSFVYDNRGNTTFDGTYHKMYDSENRLIKDSSSPTSVVAYTYDALNRRVIKWVNNNPLKYSYSGIAQIEERDGGNALLNSTVFTNFLSPVSNDKNGSRFYFHANEMMSVEAITNQNGGIAEKYNYDAYSKQTRTDSAGNILPSSIAGNRFGFTGQEYDSATGNNNFFFRNYSPATGVFAQRDLIEYGDGTSMYQYVGNNPANGLDILGLENCGGRDGDAIFSLSVSASGAVTGGTEFTFSSLSEEFLSEADKLNWETKLSPFQKGLKKFGHQSLAETNNIKRAAKVEGMMGSASRTSKIAGGAKLGGMALGGIDVVLKGLSFADKVSDGQTSEYATEEIQAGGDLGLSILGFSGPGAVIGVTDLVMDLTTGEGLTSHTAHTGEFAGELWSSFWDGRPTKMQWGRPARRDESVVTGNAYAYWFYGVGTEDFQEVFRKIPCPDPPGGTRKPPPGPGGPGQGGNMEVLASNDPNEIIGPDGVKDGEPDKKWVSVKDRMPYTILYENSIEASAPAKFVRITAPVQAKMDANTFQLGDFGFNSTTFSIPPNTAAYYSRVDVRDSIGLYVDVTAGYDQMNNVAFWEFQSIDPVTLLPPNDPLSGFLQLQDSTKETYGHGFVNFSIIPKQSAITLDTIGARADILFDDNDTIPTNIFTNTIDAFAPTSQMSAITTGPGNDSLHLSWTGADDTNGVGIEFYTLYISKDQTNYSVFASNMKRTDTSIVLPRDTTYCFFVLATDRVGNMETLRQTEVKCRDGGVVLPVTMLYFRGENKDKDNILQWATTSEINAKEFIVERSFTALSFTPIGTVAARGNNGGSYEFTDRRIDRQPSSVFYYRLRQVDKDGKFVYSNAVKLTYKEGNKNPSIVYPNPTKALITVSIGDPALIGTDAILVDVSGKRLQVAKLKTLTQTFDLGQYVNGIYFIKLSNGETLRILKQ